MPLVKSTTPSSTPTTGNTGERKYPSFANCERSAFAGGHSDWLSLEQFPDFDMCPDCFNTSIKHTPYARFVVRSGLKPENMATRCDFSDLWVRIAYSWLFTQNQPDLSLLGRVASTFQDPEGVCPNHPLNGSNDPELLKLIQRGERPQRTRTWHCIVDPKTSTAIDTLTLCSHCKSCILTIFPHPSLPSLFASATPDNSPALATCDFTLPPADQARTLVYVDELINITESYLHTGAQDPGSFVDCIRKWAEVPTCKSSNASRAKGEMYYSIPGHLEWTVCEEHYLNEIRPLYAKSSQPILLSQVSAKPTASSSTDGFKCQLSTPRLRNWWSDALGTNDLHTLRRKISERESKLREVRTKMDGLQLQLSQARMQAEYHMNMMAIEQSSAMSQSVAWTVSGWSAPIDFRGANTQLGQAGDANMQAAMIAGQIDMLQREWDENWE